MKMTETELLRAAALRFREENLKEIGKRVPVSASLDKRVRRRIRREKGGKRIPFKTLALLAAAILTVGVAVLGLPILRRAIAKVPAADHAEPEETPPLPTEEGAPVSDMRDEPLTEDELTLRLDQVTAALIEHGQLCDIRRDFLMKWQEGASMIGWLTGWVPEEGLPFDPEEVMAVFEQNESEGEPLPPLYRIARELNIPKEDFQAILARGKAAGIVISCTDEMIDRFYWPEDEAVRGLKQPSALLFDGKVYSWSEIMTMRKEGTLFESIPAEIVQEHIDKVIRYCGESGIVTLDDMARYLADPEPVSYYVLYDADAQTVFGTGGGEPPEARYPEVILSVPDPLTEAVGGGDMTLSRQWLDYTYDIACMDTLYAGEPSVVDPEVLAAWGSEYASRPTGEQNRMPTLYQAVHELGISEEDFSALNRWREQNGDGGNILTEQEIHALYLPEEEARGALKSPTALEYGGTVYAWNDLVRMQREGTLENVIPEEILEQHIRRIEEWCAENGIASENVMRRYLEQIP